MSEAIDNTAANRFELAVDGHLAIAKFPNQGDEVNTVRWEAVALTLAAKAGITVPTWRLETVESR